MPAASVLLGVRVEAVGLSEVGLSVDTCSAAGTPDSATPDAAWSWRFAHWMWWPVPHTVAPSAISAIQLKLKLISRDEAPGRRSPDLQASYRPELQASLRPGDLGKKEEEAEAALGVAELALAKVLASPHEALLFTLPVHASAHNGASPHEALAFSRPVALTPSGNGGVPVNGTDSAAVGAPGSAATSLPAADGAVLGVSAADGSSVPTRGVAHDGAHDGAHHGAHHGASPVGTLLVRVTWRPTLDVPDATLPLDVYGFQVL
jgi:hypothetical protein